MSQKISPELKGQDHVLCFPVTLTSVVDLQAAFRDTVQRLRGIFTDRILGTGQMSLTESDRKLLQGELEILVPPGHTITLVGEPQVVFRPERLMLDDESADHFQVYDVKVGRNSQLLCSATPMPGTLFKHSTSIKMSMDTAQLGQRILVSLTNASTSPQPVPQVTMLGSTSSGDSSPDQVFQAGIYGPAI